MSTISSKTGAWLWSLLVLSAIVLGLEFAPVLAGVLRDRELLGAAAAYLLLAARLGLPPEERTHLMEYGVLVAFVYEALTERANNGGHVLYPAATAVGRTALVGLADEAVESVVPVPSTGLSRCALGQCRRKVVRRAPLATVPPRPRR